MDMTTLLAGGAPPVMAILRGLTPADAPAIGDALVAAGLRFIEVPLNSPEPFESIALLQAAHGGVACIGAGTVLDVAAVDRLADTGARILVSPNVDAPVIARAVARGLEPMPGFLTPTEAFVAIGAGARRLKIFPSASFGPGYVRAIREVLPRDVALWAVGGTGAANLQEWLDAGCEGIGVGSALYRAGDAPAVVGERARALVDAWRQARPRTGGAP
jgi:2-dehydro-3-deoxyphosphogalactonate aldolase